MNDVALIVAMPIHHLESAATICDREGHVVLPAGGPGDLAAATAGMPVLLVPAPTEPEDQPVPAATWRARFRAVVAHEEGDALPGHLPPTWVDEYEMRRAATGPEPASERPLGDADEEDQDDDVVGPQSFFEIDSLIPIERAAWVFTNELVPKQERRGRAFIPRVPRLVQLPI